MKILLVENINTTRGAAMSMRTLVKNLHFYYNVEFTVLQHKENENTIFYDNININHIVTGHTPHMQTLDLSNKTYIEQKIILLKRLRWILKDDANAYNRILNAVNLKEYDLIYTNVNRYTLGHKISHLNRLPHIVHLREFGDLDFGAVSVIPKCHSRLDPYVTKYIAISETVKHHFIKKGINSNKIDVIYNGVENHFEKKAITDDIYKKNWKIVIVGAIIPTKGHLDVIRAIGSLKDCYKEKIIIDVYGNGDNRFMKMLVVEAKMNSVQLNVCGQSKMLNKLLPQYDIGVMASKAEAFGRVTVEYMMAGLFVIASNTGANPEIITEKYGALYPLGDIKKMAEKIEWVINNPATARKIANNAKIYATEEFTDKRNAENVYRLFQQVIGDGKNYV